MRVFINKFRRKTTYNEFQFFKFRPGGNDYYYWSYTLNAYVQEND